MPTEKELRKISNTRLDEVKALYGAQLYDGAHYLAGYAVETALKARVCKILNSDYPDSGTISKSFLTHDFEVLFKLAGLKKAFDSELNANPSFKANWIVIKSWSESLRYEAIGASSAADVSQVINALEDQNDGILTWIKKQW